MGQKLVDKDGVTPGFHLGGREGGREGGGKGGMVVRCLLLS